MCLGIPGQVIALSEAGDEMATVRVSNVERRISMALVAPGVAAGDWVLVHAGLALSILSAEEARETLALLRELSEAFTGELSELSEVTSHTA